MNRNRAAAFAMAAILAGGLQLLQAAAAETRAVSGTISEAGAAMALLSRAGEDGLDPQRYRVGDSHDSTAVMMALNDYARDMSGGRADLRTLDADVVLPPPQSDSSAGLSAAIAQGSLMAFLTGLPPSNPEYVALKNALARYRGIAAAGGWPLLTPQASEAELRARLGFEDRDAAASPLPGALKRFQARHGLPADGALNAATLAALNVPATARADTIVANLERWRWMPRQPEPDRIVINAADARLEMFLGGESVLTSRVIVGKPATLTPILRGQGAGVTFNPAWTVPHSIAVREILPKLKRNHAYLASQDMFLVNGPTDDPQGLRIDWHTVNVRNFPYQIRQYPGPKNPLGLVKLELPNQFDVYLHDTPGKTAFNAASRAVSHGCVRVEQIMPLAPYTLAADLSAIDKINDAIGTGQTSYLPMKKNIPIYFLYWTAFVDADGAPEFRRDLYGRDERLLAALAMRVAQAAVTPGCRKA